MKRTTPYIPAIILAFALITGAVFFVTPMGQHLLNKWKLLPQPERLTELYFTDHKTLPTTYKPESSQTVAFTLHNIEYGPVVYNYKIIQAAQDGSAEQTLATGSCLLQYDQTQNITKQITLANKGSRSKITVHVDFTSTRLGNDSPTDQTQSIHYWVNNK